MKLWGKHRRSAPRLAPRHGFVNSEVTSPSLPRKSFGRKTDEGPLEPFPRGAPASRRRSFSHPILPEGTESAALRLGGEVASSSLPEKDPRRKPNRGRALPLSYCPIDGGADRIRTNNGALRSEVTLISLPGKLEPPAGCAPALRRYKGRASLSTLKRRKNWGETRSEWFGSFLETK